METPLCLSLYFVNKQNVRSYQNILKNKLLKSVEIETFLKHIFNKNITLLSEVSSEFRLILCELQLNLRSCCKQDFKNYFPINNISPALVPVDKNFIFTKCWIALYEIIPQKLFGSNHNVKIFWKILRMIIFSMYRQHFIIRDILKKWDFSGYSWNLVNTDVINITLLWIFRNILSPMICLNFYVTTCKLDADEYKLHYFWKNQWQSFYDKKIAAMSFTKVLKRFEPYCLSKSSKIKYSHRERLRLNKIKNSIPKLHLILKPNKDCRPIVRYKYEIQSVADKYKIKERFAFLKLLTNRSQEKFETLYQNLYMNWVNKGKPQLYFIKSDLSNAFGSIDKEKLLKILAEKHLSFQMTEKNVILKRKLAQQYKDMVTKLRNPLLIRAGSTVYEWKKGLVQGYKYSPALSEMYYTYLDHIYLTKHVVNAENSTKLFIRVVDDYLYVTDTLDDAKAFLLALSNYRNINYTKTVVNFEYENIKHNNEIVFLGYSYNTTNLNVSRAKNVYSGLMCYKIAFSCTINNIYKFLENRIGQSGIQISSQIFNLYYNTEEQLWQHIFSTLCLSANKFCTILSLYCEENEMKPYLLFYKKKVSIKLCNAMINTVLKHKPKQLQFLYCFNHLRYLSWKALHLCAKDTRKCWGLIKNIKDEINKSDCLFGRWKNHSSRIDVNGESLFKAKKENCKRVELKSIFKNFEKLPVGFQCLKSKKAL